MRNWIGKLLYIANSNPYNKYVFYPWKAKILKKYGKFIGCDIQHIVKKCWSCGGTGYYLPGVLCNNCYKGTTGNYVYSEVWWVLDKYELGKYKFYVPREKIPYLKELPLTDSTIEGYVEHKTHKNYKEAYYILLFLFDIKKFLSVIWCSLCWKIKCLKYKLINRGKSDWDIPF